MKICAISDMHGNLQFDIEKCDLLLIGGDIMPLGIQHYTKPSEVWLDTVFLPWCVSQPCERVIFIGGNHDSYLFNHGQDETFKNILAKYPKVTYLDCGVSEYNGLRIYGTPKCKIFGRWSFMYSDEEQSAFYKNELNTIGKIDIVLSHDAPYGVSDVLLQDSCPWANGNHIGNKPFAEFLKELKPRYNFHGHLHSCNHEKEMLDDTEVYNVSLLDEFYVMAYKPLYINID